MNRENTNPQSVESDQSAEALLTPAEVAALFRVDPKTVTRWAVAGKLTSLRTLGGHRRYRAAQVHALLAEAQGESMTNGSADHGSVSQGSVSHGSVSHGSMAQDSLGDRNPRPGGDR